MKEVMLLTDIFNNNTRKTEFDSNEDYSNEITASDGGTYQAQDDNSKKQSEKLITLNALSKTSYILWELCVCIAGYFSLRAIGVEHYMALPMSISIEILYSMLNINSKGEGKIYKYLFLLYSTSVLSYLGYINDPNILRSRQLNHEVIQRMEGDIKKIEKRNKAIEKDIIRYNKLIDGNINDQKAYRERGYISKGKENTDKEISKYDQKITKARLLSLENDKLVSEQTHLLNKERERQLQLNPLTELSKLTLPTILIIFGITLIQVGYSYLIPSIFINKEGE